MKRLVVRLVDGLATVALGIAAAWALGFFAVLVGRLVLVPLWSRRRHHAG